MEGGLVKTRPLRPLEAVRAFGMMLGGPIALAASAAASIAAVVRASLSLRRPPTLALLGTAATGLYALVIRPWHLRWGAELEDDKREVQEASFYQTTGRRSSAPSPSTHRSRRCGPGLLSSAKIAPASTATSGLRTSRAAR